MSIKIKFLVFMLLISICSILTADQSYVPSGAVPDQYAELTGNHALVLFKLLGKKLHAYFDLEPDSIFTTIDGGSGQFSGTLVQQGFPTRRFSFTATLSNAHFPATGMPLFELKEEAYVPVGPIDPDTWTFYDVEEFDLIGLDDFAGAVLHIKPFKTMEELQLGIGANGKNILLGFSHWIKYRVISQPTQGEPFFKVKAKGDFHVQLEPDDINICVEEAESDNCATSTAPNFAFHLASVIGNGDFIFNPNSGTYIEDSIANTVQITGRLESAVDAGRVFNVVCNFSNGTDIPPAGSPILELNQDCYCGGGKSPEGDDCVDISDFYYYTDWSCTLTGEGSLENCLFSVDNADTAAQFGQGANNRNTTFGAYGTFVWEDETHTCQELCGDNEDCKGAGTMTIDIFVCDEVE